MDQENQEVTIDLVEIFELLRQHLLVIILSTVVAGAVGFVATFFLATPKYEAVATMIVNTRQDASATVTNDQLNSASRLVDTYSIIIRSDTVLQRVINTLNLPYTFEELQSFVSVTAVNNTQVMRITVTLPDVEQARQICEQITLVAPAIIVESVEAGSVKVISQARPNPNPVSPHVMRDTAIMAMLGMVGSIGVLLMMYMLNNKINNEEDVARHLGLSVLGVIPMYEGGKR